MRWLEWVQRLQAIAQNGLTYAKDPFDVERYQAIRQIAAEMGATYGQVEVETVATLFAENIGYATPKLDVRGAVFQDDKILMVRGRQDQLWTLPGGWIDVGEAPGTAVTKEIREESGYLTQPVKLVACYDRNLWGERPYLQHIYKLFFHCELVGGEPQTSLETDKVAFFPPDELPPNLSTARVTHAQIQTLFQHYHNPDLPTEFD
ncbi:MAG: NUDIX hydrolase [Anaerolineaceae bacterium]|nr:NUDIX hydrolase [Anaerolineaceae bacterium]